MKCAADVQPCFHIRVTVDDFERGFDFVDIDRLRVVIPAGLLVPLLTFAVRTAFGGPIANSAAVFEDRSGIEIIAQIEKIPVDHFDAVMRVIDVAEQVRLRQHKTFRRDLAVEQTIDACDKFSPASPADSSATAALGSASVP